MAARGGGAGAMEKQVGRKARCHAPGSRRGGCHPKGSRGVGADACCRPPCMRRSRERGLAADCPRLEEPSPSARRQRSVGPSTKDIQYHRMTPRVRASQLVEAAVCLGTGPRSYFCILFFSLSSLPLLILLSPVLSPRLSLPPGPDRPPREEGGGVESSLEGTPGLRGALGVCDEWGRVESRGNGARPVE